MCLQSSQRGPIGLHQGMQEACHKESTGLDRAYMLYPKELTESPPVSARVSA